MKKIFLSFILIVLTTLGCYAKAINPADYDEAGSNLWVPVEICTVTSEPCKLSDQKSSYGQMSRYKCCVSAKTGFTDLVADIYKYIFFISLVLGVALMVFLGIGIALSGFDEGKIKEAAKSQLVATLIGIIALALIPWILQTIAPFIFTK